MTTTTSKCMLPPSMEAVPHRTADMSPDGLWQENLQLLEEQILAADPRLRFLCAPGLLFAAIAWLQSQMVRLLVLKCAERATGHAPHELWKDKDLFREHVVPKLNEAHRKDLRPVAGEFRTVFCLSRDEDQALWCLQCLRNMLAHGALSPYQVSAERCRPKTMVRRWPTFLPPRARTILAVTVPATRVPVPRAA